MSSVFDLSPFWFGDDFLPGLIAGRLLSPEDQAEVAKTLLMQTIFDWVSMCDDDEDITVERGCDFLVQLTKHTSSAVVLSTNPSWLQEAKAAVQVFEGNLVHFTRDWAVQVWKSSGPDEVAGTLGNCKFVPQELQSTVRLSRSVSMLDDLDPIEFKFEDLDKELPQLIKPVKKWMALLGMDLSLVEKLMSQSKVEEIDKFQTSVVKAIKSVVTLSTTAVEEIKPIVDKYRPQG